MINISEEQLLEKINGFLEKYNGYLGITAALIGTIMVIIASILHATAGPFSFFTHWISNLGVGPNGSMYVFNIGLVITVFSFTPFMIYMIKFALNELKSDSTLFKRFSVIATIILSILTLLGLFLVALFPMWPETIIMHFIAAMMFFLGSMFWTVSFTITLFLFRKISIVQITATVVAVVIVAIFLGNIVFLATTVGIPTDLAAFISTSGTPLWVRFWEWMYLFAILAYVFLTSIYVIRYIKK